MDKPAKGAEEKVNPTPGFGARLKAAITRSEKSNAEVGRLLAEELDITVHRSSIGDWIAERNRPEMWKFAALCKILNESADHLLFDGISKSHPPLAVVMMMINELPEAQRQALIDTLVREQEHAAN